MERAAVLVAALTLVVSARKCCPRDQVLTPNLTCAMGNSHILLYDSEVVLPFNCSGDLNLVPATNETKVDCIDVRVDGKYSALKGVVCTNKNETNKKVSVPQVNFLRKCCPVSRRYSNFQDGCWKEDFPDDSGTVDKLRQMFLNGTNSAVELAVGIPRCPKGMVLRDVVLHHRHVWRQESESILLKHQGSSDILLIPEEFCVDLVTEDDYSLVVRMCQDASITCGSNKLPCINKCCPEGSSHQRSPCTRSKESFNVDFYNMSPPKPPIPSSVLSVGLAFENQFLKCQYGKYSLDPQKIPSDAFYVLDNGQLFVPQNPPESRLINWKDYCLERLGDKVFPFLCFRFARTTKETQESAHFQVIAYGLVLSSVFLLITFLVYLCLPTLHNLHGKTLMCHVAALLSAYSALICSQLFSGSTPPLYCKLISYAIQFFFLAAFSWLNVICFDIWWTFGAIKSHIGKKEESRRKFLLYSLYAWFLPLAITMVTFLVDSYRLLPDRFLPSMGVRYCWFTRDTHGKTVFFNLPVMVQVTTNIVFFALTIRNCSRIKSELQHMQNNSNAKLKYNSDVNKLAMNTKLFVVMGLTWACEVITWYFQSDNDTVWYILDAANIFQGFFIFLIFVIKKKVLRAVNLRLHDVLPSCLTTDMPKHRPSTSTIFTTVASSDSSRPPGSLTRK